MTEPAWIEFYFKRRSSTVLLSTPFMLAFTRDYVHQMIESHSNAANELRAAALARLNESEPGTLCAALAALLVVGEQEDRTTIQTLLAHGNKRVSDAARTCLFELKKKF